MSEETAPVAVLATSTDQMIDVLVESILPSPWQRRRYFDPESLKELADSIKITPGGLIQRIVIRRFDDNGAHELIVGERRWRAYKLLGRETIPVILKDISADEARVMLVTS